MESKRASIIQPFKKKQKKVADVTKLWKFCHTDTFVEASCHIFTIKLIVQKL